jgi:hypothetical protein
MATEQGESSQCMITGNTRQHVQVIIHNYRVNCFAGYIDHMCPAASAYKATVLHTVDPGNFGQYLGIHRDGRYDNNSSGRMLIRKNMFKLLLKPFL